MKVGSLFSGIGGMCYNPPMPRGNQPKTYPAAQVAEVRRLYESGQTQVEVAAAMGLTQKIIWNLMRRHNIPRRKAIKRDQRGAKNDSWKGGDGCYTALHERVAVLRGKPQLCQVCGASGPGRTYDWANMTGKYDDPADYKRLCRSCHWKLDGQYRNFQGGAKCQQND